MTASARQESDPEIRQVQGTVVSREAVYEVESVTRSGHMHTVTVTEDGSDDRWMCTCEAGQYATACWHRDYVRAVHYWYRFERRQQTRRQRALQVEARKRGLHEVQRPDGMAAVPEACG
jgi:hypothetical protein